MILRLTFTFILVATGLAQTSWSTEFLESSKGICYYRFQKTTLLPDQFTQVVKPMYFKAYDPALHEGYSLEDMGLDPKFQTYEKFLSQLIDDDFKLYATNTDRVIFFATLQECQENYENVCGFCVFLPEQQEGEYYLDHIGVKDTYQRQGIGHKLLNLAMSSIAAKVVALDTRVFNTPAQYFYEKEMFTKVMPHPISKKEGRYFRYVKRVFKSEE